VACIVLAGAIVVATTSNMAGAAEPVKGVGSATGGTTVLSIDAGDLLKLAVLSEQSGSSIDPTDGTPTAIERLVPLSLSSAQVPALNSLSVPALEVKSTGEEVRKDATLINLADATSAVPGIVSGTINPATLAAAVDAIGARSALTTKLADVAVLGGIVDSGTLEALLGGVAASTSSTSARGIDLDSLTVLDLGSLLEMLGTSVAELPLGTAATLLGDLGLLGPVSAATGLDLSSPQSLLDARAALQAVATGAQTTVATATAALNTATTNFTANLCNTVPVQPLCTTLQTAVTAAQQTLATAQAALADALGDLLALLDSVLDTLDGAALVKVEAVTAGVKAIAKDTVAGSSANVTAAIGKLTVGGVDLGALDANATLQQLAGLANQTATQLNGILAKVHPSLGSLVTVKLLDEATGVTQEGSLVKALARLTAVTITVTPPDLCGLLTGLNPAASVGSALQSVGGQLPATPVANLLGSLPAGVADVACSQASAAGLVNGVAAAIAQPVTVRAVQVQSAASFRAVAGTPATPGSPTLPRTGGSALAAPVIAAMIAAAALGLRRVVRTVSTS
jgi:hypothetical protein